MLKPPDDQLPGETPPVDFKPITVDVSSLGNVESASLVLLGTAHAGMGDLHSAIECFKLALTRDVFCEEALDHLCKYHALTAEEETNLFASMPFKKQCSMEEEFTLKLLYQQKMKHLRKHTSITQFKSQESLQPLCSNLDVLTNVADQYFQSMNIDACYKLTTEILEQDPYHNSALLLHVACCVQKRKSEELFSLGHQLVDYFPNSALSWYTVGCYYLAIDKHPNARKYLMKAINLDPHFSTAHMAFGVSFASQGEHDQAISAFSNAARVMRGSHLPLLSLGKEYYLTGATSTSIRFMKSAIAVAPHNPTLLHEVGYMVSNSGDYAKAEKYFSQAIIQLRNIDPHVTLHIWEPVYNNLGHVLRKQQKFEQALKAHSQALQLQPNEASTLTAIAFVYLLMGNYEKVIEFANQSLRLKREDQFTLEVLHTAMEEAASVPLMSGGSEIETGGKTLEELESEKESELFRVEDHMLLLGRVGAARKEEGSMQGQEHSETETPMD